MLWIDHHTVPYQHVHDIRLSTGKYLIYVLCELVHSFNVYDLPSTPFEPQTSESLEDAIVPTVSIPKGESVIISWACQPGANRLAGRVQAHVPPGLDFKAPRLHASLNAFSPFLSCALTFYPSPKALCHQRYGTTIETLVLFFRRRQRRLRAASSADYYAGPARPDMAFVVPPSPGHVQLQPTTGELG